MNLRFFGILLCAALSFPSWAAASEERFELFGDLRGRFESDFDSQRADGRERMDRDRLRLRARLGVRLHLTDRFSFQARVRTGSSDSQQSPHVTLHDFDDNRRGDLGVVPDQWFLRFDGAEGWAWLGRNSFPFWKPTELLWDDDVTLVGGAAGKDLTATGGTWTLVGGHFALPDGAVDLHGRLTGGQLRFQREEQPWHLQSALGYFAIEGEEGAQNLRFDNGVRDYRIWAASFRLQRQIAGGVASGQWALAFEALRNAETYRPEEISMLASALRVSEARLAEERDGWTASIQWRPDSGDDRWTFTGVLARIEALAVHPSYAQDDWMRWGSATQSDASDYRGYELRARYETSNRSNLVLRFFQVESVVSEQDGSRARLDFNVRF